MVIQMKADIQNKSDRTLRQDNVLKIFSEDGVLLGWLNKHSEFLDSKYWEEVPEEPPVDVTGRVIFGQKNILWVESFLPGTSLPKNYEWRKVEAYVIPPGTLLISYEQLQEFKQPCLQVWGPK